MVRNARFLALASLAVVASPFVSGCGRQRTYRTTVELTRVHAFGRDPRAPGMMDVEMRYVDCPGDARKLIRGDKDFAACGLGLKVGSKVPVDVVSTYVPDRNVYRSDVVRIGDCTIKTDPRDEANYERIEVCSDLKMTGAVVGVHCERKRSEALVAKCPWLRRN